MLSCDDPKAVQDVNCCTLHCHPKWRMQRQHLCTLSNSSKAIQHVADELDLLEISFVRILWSWSTLAMPKQFMDQLH